MNKKLKKNKSFSMSQKRNASSSHLRHAHLKKRNSYPPTNKVDRTDAMKLRMQKGHQMSSF